MNPERLRRLEALYDEAASMEPAARDRFIDERCAGDEELGRELKAAFASGSSGLTGLVERAAAEAASGAEPWSGRRVGPYRIVEPLGHGGMATVYKAYQPTIDRYVAVKVLGQQFAADVQFVSRFRHEAKIVAQLQHPHILPIFDFGETGGSMFLAMAFLPGGTLADRLAKAPLPLAFVEHVVTQVCGALDYAHAKGVVHRDIKPTNILIDEVGNCLLADFGIAHLAGDLTRLTMPGSLMGTPAYMSPEQASGDAVGPRSDLYSLGIVLFEMLTGRVPFEADTPVGLAVKHVAAPMPSPRVVNETITPAIESVVMKALARAPGDRYASGAEFAAAFADAIRLRLVSAETRAVPEAPAASAQTLVTPPPKAASSSRWYGVGAVAVAAAAVAAAAIVVGPRWRTSGPTDSTTVVTRTDGQPMTAPPPPQPQTVERAPDLRRSQGRGPERAVHPEARAGAADAAASGAASAGRTGSSPAFDTLDVPSLERLCDGGDTRACNELGDRHRGGRGVAKDDVRAASLFQRACNGGGFVGCDNLGLAYGRGAGVAKDDARAVALFQKACDGGRGSGCWHLGAAYETGRGIAKDDRQAASLYERACDFGTPGGCGELGRLYSTGIGVPADPVKAVTLFERACDAGGLPGCVNLGMRYLTGQGVAKDEARALPLFVKACDGQTFGGCFQAGRMYAQALGVELDPVRATSYFERACTGGMGPACMALAMRHRNGGPPFTKDESQAVAFFERACDLRVAEGCSNAAEAFRDGRGVEKNAGRAAEFARRAQDLSRGDVRSADATGTTATVETAPVAVDDTGWMVSEEYQRAFNVRRSRSFYPSRVEGRVNNGRDEFRAEWKPSSGSCRWASFHRLPKQAFDENSARYASQGFTLSSTAQFVDATGTTRYQGTWTKDCAPPPAPPVRVGGDVKPPAQTKYVKPVFPPAAQKAGVRGVVVVEATIGTNGHVTDAKILRSIPTLDQAALDAVKQWEYTPTLSNGVPVSVIIAVTVNFSLQ